MSSNGGIMIKLGKCLWLALVWMPIFWPLWFSHWVLTSACSKPRSSGRKALDDKIQDDKEPGLSTKGSLGLFIILAAAVLKIGSLMSWAAGGWMTALREVQNEVADESMCSPEPTFHTPPSSPPPFDAVSPKDAAGGHVQHSAAAPTLRERLRNLGQTISVLRRFGGASLVSSKPVTSSISFKPRDQADFRLGISRSMRTYNLFEEIKSDYEKAEESLKHGGGCREQVMRTLHERSARKVLELARTNGGLYTKAAQFVASLQGGAGDKGIPKEYVEVLRVLTDSAPFRPLSEMDQVLKEDFEGRGTNELFASFSAEPIAAASLAQVHRAMMHDGTEVAVKMMYPTLKKEMASDFAMFRRLGSQIQPGGYDLGWMVTDFEDAIKCELDLEGEARNSEITAQLFEGRKGIIVPRVIWDLTRENVLTMEYVDGLLRVTEPEVIKANNLNLGDCGKLLSDTLAEMALCWGHVHGDPHAGNIYVCAERSGILGHVRPVVTLLDHGLYHDIDEVLRRDLCLLFNACIARNRPEILRLSERITGPMHRFFPLLLSPWFILGTQLSWEDLDAAQNNRLPPSITSKDVGSALEALHNSGGAVLGVLHSFGYTRGLLNSLRFPERRRLKSLSTFATLGIMPRDIMERALREGLHTLPMRWRLKIWLGWIQVDVSAVMLRMLSITMRPELDTSHSTDACIILADCILEIGRMSLLQFVARLLGMAEAQSTRATASVGAECEAGSGSSSESSSDASDSDDSISSDDALRPRMAGSRLFSRGVPQEGRWQAAISRVRSVVQAEEGQEPVGGVRGLARRAVTGLAKRVLRVAGGEEKTGTRGSPASSRMRPQGTRGSPASPKKSDLVGEGSLGDGSSNQGKTRRKRHYSPSNRESQGRPWV